MTIAPIFSMQDLANTDVFSAGKGKDKFKLANYIVHRPKNLFTLLGTAVSAWLPNSPTGKCY